jgi:DNA repair exonuclease SbcCD ATPase subunit
MSNESELTTDQVDAFFESQGESIPEGFDAPVNEQNAEGDSEVIQEVKETSSTDADKLSEKAENYRRAMEEERAEKRELKKELQRLKDEREQKEQPQQEEEIDDPIEALNNKLSKIESEANQQKEQQRIQNEFNAFAEEVSRDTRQFAESTPDYIEAYNHLVASRLDELKILGYSEGQAKEMVAQQELELAYISKQNGANPAETVYNLSKQRGFVPKLDQKSAETSRKMDNMERGIAASMSLGSSSGQSDQGLSLESFAHLEGQALLDAVSNDAAWKKLANGL